MRSSMFLILLVLLAGITYTAWRIWHILPVSPGWKWLSVILYLLCFASLFVHYGLEERLPLGIAAATYETGTSWMIFFLYALLLFAALDLGRILHLVPLAFLKQSVAGTCTVLGGILVLLTCGGVHYHHKYREEITVETEKVLERPVTIVLASDLHVGYHNRRAELARWVDLINAENPDLVLFAGDILDGSVRPARAWDYAGELQRLKAPVYACPGNHEYITGLDAALSFLSDAGIQLLRDSSVTVNGIRIVGRDDRSNPDRLPIPRLAPESSIPTLLLDHQPYHLEEAEACGVDFQFSGHTHHGQVWPGNWVTDAMFEKAFGAYRKGKTRYYISSGLGIWGGKFRIGTRSEYIVLTLSHPSRQ